jgi:AcrR family transcriptional regulator
MVREVSAAEDTGRAPRLSRADAVRNRARILAAADELLARDGVDVPLDDIARRAGVGPGTLHRHFPTKAELVGAVLAERLARRVDEAARALEEEGARAGSVLRELIERLLDDGLANRALKQLLEAEGLPLGDRSAVRAFHSLLTRLVGEARRERSVRDDLRREDVEAILAGALAAQDHAGGRRERIDRVRRLILSSLDGPSA